MPKIYLSRKAKLNDRFVVWLTGQMSVKGISQKRLADVMEISQQALSKKIRAQQFSFTDFITIVEFFEPEVEDIAWLIGRKGSI